MRRLESARLNFGDFLLQIIKKLLTNERAAPVARVATPLPPLPVTEAHRVEHLSIAQVIPSYPAIFFDVDGVLHPYQTGSLGAVKYLTFLCEENPKIQLIMSSNWRETMDIDSYRREFPAIVVERTVGFTPVLKSRQEEVMAFVNHHGIRSFVCIDDDESLFSKDWLHLYLTDRATGMSKRDALNILNFFNEVC